MTLRTIAGTMAGVCALLMGHDASAQTSTSLDAKVQAPELAPPQRGSLAGQLASTTFGPADVARGGFTLPTPIAVPQDRGALLAEAFPRYSPDAAISEWGAGWHTQLEIRRYRVSGDLDYATDELTGPFGRLVSGTDGAWYPVGLGRSVRVVWSGNSIVATLADGTVMTFGGASVVTTAKGIYSWPLVEVRTVTNRKTRIDWTANASGRPFVAGVSWGGVGDDYQYRADLAYDVLALAFEDYRSGQLLSLDRRVRSVTVLAKNAATGSFEERWHSVLTYQDEGLGPAYYLASVQQVFASGETPPATRYTYRLAKDTLPGAPLAAAPAVASVLSTLGPDALQPSKSTPFDSGDDGLLDLEYSVDYQLIHQTQTGFSLEPLAPAPPDTFFNCRSAPSNTNRPRTIAQLRSNAGDDAQYVVDLRPDGSGISTAFSACNRVGQRLGAQTLPGNWGLGSTVRLVDLNRDHAPDLVRIQAGAYKVLPNTSTAGSFSFGAQKQGPLSPVFTPDTAWVQDMNGDGIADLVARYSSGLVVWYGKGNLDFVSTGRSFTLRTASGITLSSVTGYSFTFVDANKDGLTDLVVTNASTNQAYLYVNRGTYFQETNVVGLRSVDAYTSKPVIGDFSGSGNTEISYTRAGQGYAVALDGPDTSLLSSADDGRGTVISFEYGRAAPAAGARQRQSVVSRVTVASSGYDAIAYDYTYSGPRLHSVGKFLLGFDRVVRADPNVNESADLLNEDRYSGVLLGTATHDAKAPAADAFTSKAYDEALTAGVPFKRLRQETKGFRDASGATVSETTDYLGYALDVCPASVRTSLVPGTLTVTKTYARPPAFANSFSCLVSDVVEQGAHSDPSLDFTHEVAIARNDVGLVTKVESVTPAGRWTLQDVGYDSELLLTSAGAPGRGTSTFQYEPGTRLLLQVTAPTGVTTQVTSRHATTDLILTLLTRRGAASWQQFFTYDGQERLATRRNDLGGATALNPNERYSYRYATASTPASVALSTLIDAATASARDEIALATAAGEAVGTVTRVPEGWAFGRLANRSRARSEEQGLLRGGAASTTDPTAIDYPTLFTGAAAVDFIGSSTLAKAVDERTTFHAGVERRVATAQSITGGTLVRTATENGAASTTWRMDASRRVLSFDDEANVRYTYTYDALGRVRQVLLPDGRKHTASYDGHGRPTRIVREGIAIIDVAYDAISGLPSSKSFSSPAGQARRTVSWTYDSMGRITQEQHADPVSGATKAYVSYYDGATPSNPTATNVPGLLTAVTGDGYTKLLEYRVDGVLTKRTVSLAGWRSVETTLSYVESGAPGTRKVRLLDASGAQIAAHDWRYDFDATGRPLSMTLNGAGLASFGYDANGLLTSASFANGDALTLDHDVLTRRTVGSTQATALTSAQTVQRMNTRGLVDHEDFQAGATAVGRQYSYSSQRFLVSAVDGQHSYGYGFDSFGLPISTATDGVTTSIAQAGGTLTVGSSVIQFDDLGRVVSRGNRTFTYGPDSQVATAQTGGASWSFLYDENGQRRVKLSGAVGLAAYVDDGYIDASGLTEPLAVGGRVVGLVKNGAYQTVPTDLRGTVLAEVDGTPRVASPFGQRDVHPASAAALDYVQKGFDADLGLVRMGVRDYDPQLNRFTTPDSLFIDDPSRCVASPGECNLYGYAGNDPSSHVDPTGYFIESPWDAVNVALDIWSLQDNFRHHKWGWVAVDTVALTYDSIALATPFLPAGAGAALKAYRAGSGVVHALEVGSDVVKVADKAHEAARASSLAANAAKEGSKIHRQVGEAMETGNRLSESARNFFKGANGATGPRADLTWGKVPGLWLDLTTSGQWAKHVRTYGPQLGEGIPLLYERGQGLVNTLRLSTGAGMGSMVMKEWLEPSPSPEEMICK